MAKELSQTILDRRTVLRRGLLVGLGAAAVGMASPALTGRARATTLSPTQNEWAWCNKCEGMFYHPQVAQSHCPRGYNHAAQDGSWEYALYYDVPPGSPINQNGWYWCGKCRGLFYGGNTTINGGCPAPYDAVGYAHNGSGSFNYTMIYNEPSLTYPQWQDQWRWCYKCQGMFYGPNASSSMCPVWGAHDASGGGGSPSYDYYMSVVQFSGWV